MSSPPRAASLAVVALAVAVLAGVWFKVHHAAARSTSVTSILAEHKLAEQGATLGNPDAPVTLVDFIDLECGPAAIFHRKVMPTILDRYVRSGEIKVMLVDLGNEGNASEVAQQIFTRMAAKNLAWEWTDQVFKIEKGPQNSRSMTDPYVAGLFANIPGASMSDLGGLPDDAGVAARGRSMQMAAAIGITGTPSFSIGPSNADRSTYHLIGAGEPHIPSLSEIEEAIADQEGALGVRT